MEWTRWKEGRSRRDIRKKQIGRWAGAKCLPKGGMKKSERTQRGGFKNKLAKGSSGPQESDVEGAIGVLVKI